MSATSPYYLLRLIGGLLFLAGAALMAVNLWRTFEGAGTARVAVPTTEAALKDPAR